jgi:hypothetical protein
LRRIRLEVVEVERHLGGAGDRQQVQDGVGAAADRHDHGDGVLEGLAGQQVARGGRRRR